MQVVAMLGGLASQMSKYALYYGLSKMDNGSQCYIDTTAYHSQNMWNGYELEKVFGIKESDLYDLYPVDIRERPISYQYKALEFLVQNNAMLYYNMGIGRRYYNPLSIYGRTLNGISGKIWRAKYLLNGKNNRFNLDNIRHGEAVYFDEECEDFSVYYKYKDELKQIFAFPDFTDIRDVELSKLMLKGNSVAVHIRRTDHLYDNDSLERSGYYKNAINLIEKCTGEEKLAYYVFSDDIKWVSENLSLVGLSNKEIVYVDWHKGEESFRDMQLMTFCQHNVVPISGFSAMGSWLSKWDDKDKITVAPKGEYPFLLKHI